MMSRRTAPTKRERARNEQALKELLKVQGNDRCADCNAQNPGWASWNIGVFLCTRCASLHRKLGTHISKVKSLSLDNWESDQVDVLRLIGNINANAVWNPDPGKNPIPLNTEESDSVMERYVRNKYEYKLFRRDRQRKEAERIKETLSNGGGKSGISFTTAKRPNGSSGSSGSSTNGSSGISIASNQARSVSGTYSSQRATSSRSSSPSSKVGKVLGVEPVHQHTIYASPTSATFPCSALSVHVSGGLEDMIRQIRDMGFSDDRRSLEVLKRTGGNVQAAVEILLSIENRNSSFPVLSKDVPRAPASAPIQKTGGSSTNPFDELDRQEKLAQQQQQQQEQRQQALRQASMGSTNPFDHPHIAQIPTLFPHRTGPEQLHMSNPFAPIQPVPITPTIPAHFQQQQQQKQSDPFAPAYSTSQQPVQQYVQAPLQTPFTPSNPYSTPTSPTTAGYNPFLQPPQPAQHMAQQQLSPFGAMSGVAGVQMQSPFDQQAQMQQGMMPTSTPGFHTNSAYAQPQLQMQSPTGFYNQQPQFLSTPPQQQPQYLQPQPTGRLNKDAILSLYSMPHLAPQRPPQTQSQLEPGIAGMDLQRSASAPTVKEDKTLIPGSNNPFLLSVGGAQQGGQQLQQQASLQQQQRARTPGGRSHMTQESVDFGSWMSQSGRHSPDAFAKLSFRQ